PSGAPLRHLLRLLPLGSASGRASWDYRVQTGGPSPAPVQRAPRGPVVVPAETMPEVARVRGYEPRPREPLSLRRRYVTGDALDERDSLYVSDLGTDVKRQCHGVGDEPEPHS